MLCHVSLLDEASGCFARAHTINPRDLSSYAIWGYCRLLQLRLDEALAISDEVWAETPSAWVAYQRTRCRLQLGGLDEARRLTDTACRQFPASPLVLSLCAVVAALAGEAGESRRQIELAERHRRAFNHYHHAQYELAVALTHLGDPAAALDQLTAAAMNGFPCAALFADDPLLAPLRAEPGFGALLAEVEGERERFRRVWQELAVAV